MVLLQVTWLGSPYVSGRVFFTGTKMDSNRLNCKVFNWSIRRGSYIIKKWSCHIMEISKLNNMDQFCNVDDYIFEKIQFVS